jgi:hypothetical protein
VQRLPQRPHVFPVRSFLAPVLGYLLGEVFAYVVAKAKLRQ